MAEKPALLPDRYPISDFFVADIIDAVPKDDMASMEHPMFSLSTKPDMKTRVYEHNGNTIKVIPSGLGLATIHDKDVLIFCGSQVLAKMNRGEPVSRKIRFLVYDLLVATNRTVDGDSYRRIQDSFNRLRGTTINTDIETNGVKIETGFGHIDSWQIVTKDKNSERMVAVEVTLSEWFFNSLMGKEILTISRDYFRIRKPIERKIYELARKHCGTSKRWDINLKLLHKKTGSAATLREFRRSVTSLAEKQHLPDYNVDIHEDMVIFKSKLELQRIELKEVNNSSFPYKIHTSTYEKAKKAAPTYDIYYLEQEWISYWVVNGKQPIINPDKAFIGFCKKRFKAKPNP